MKNLFISACLLALVCGGVQAQNGGISEDVLREIKKAYKGDPTDKALQNAITSNDIRVLAINHENKAGVDTYFSDKVISHGITDQKSSGRCWLFTGLNVMRSKMMAQYNLPSLEFSQCYSFFWDQLEKANLFLQGVIDTADKPLSDRMVEYLFKHPLNDGGQFTGVMDIVGKYGVVPKEVMPETFSSENTAQISNFIKLKLREFGLQLREQVSKGAKTADLQKSKTEMLGTVYRMLVLAMGEPVTEFQWVMRDADGKPRGEMKTYTPQSFFKEFINEDYVNDYIMVMNDPSRPYWKVYEIDYDRHAYDGHNWLYVNLPVEEIKPMAIASIKDSTMMYFSCDVGKFLDRKSGILDINNFDYDSLFGTKFGMDKKQRIQTFASGSTHAMTLMAVDLDKNGKAKKWMVENSWGMTGHQGHLIMTDEWFDEYMFRLAVNKKYVSEKVLNLLKKEKPVRLPAWDPMFDDEQ